jgi:hypothetical protein
VESGEGLERRRLSRTTLSVSMRSAITTDRCARAADTAAVDEGRRRSESSRGTLQPSQKRRPCYEEARAEMLLLGDGQHDRRRIERRQEREGRWANVTTLLSPS